MEWFVGHQSALEFWRRAQASEAMAGEKLRACKPPTKLTDARGLHFESPFRLSKPLHILVGDDNARKAAKNFTNHISSMKYPGGSFIRVAPEIIMSTPELCFVQMASEYTLFQLVMLGFEFCGSYRLDKEVDPKRGFRDDIPLTSVAKLSAYIAKLEGMKGVKNARRALRFIANGSASPMETILAMLLTLPYRFGGFGFPLPLLNCPVEVSVSFGRVKRKLKYDCDIYWPDEQVDVEYDSDFYHTNEERIAKDAIRRNALSTVGVTVVTVSRMQIYNTAELRKVAEVLSKQLDRQLRLPMPEFTKKHAALRRQLLSKSSN